MQSYMCVCMEGCMITSKAKINIFVEKFRPLENVDLNPLKQTQRLVSHFAFLRILARTVMQPAAAAFIGDGGSSS